MLNIKAPVKSLFCFLSPQATASRRGGGEEGRDLASRHFQSIIAKVEDEQDETWLLKT